MIIQIDNSLDKQTTTFNSFLSTSITSGGTTIPVKNINGFTAQDYIQIGKTGEEQTELLVLSASTPSGTALYTQGTLRFNHPIDTPVFDIVFGKIVVERSTTGTAGTATAYGTVDITPDSLFTNFNDTSGVSTYAYKTKFYNDYTGNLSEESDWFSPGGPTMYSLAALRQDVKDNLFAAGYLKADDSQVDSWINKWQENMNNAALKVNQDYSLGTVAIGFGTSSYGTVTNADFKMARKMEVSYNGGVDWVNSRQIPVNQFSDTDIFTSVYPSHFWAGDNVFGIRPARSGGSVRITYQKMLPKLVNDADELTPILRTYTGGCVDYCLMRAYYTDQKIDYARDHRALFEKSKTDFISEVTPRDTTGPHTIQYDDTLSGRADDFDLEYYTW